MAVARQVVELGRAARNGAGVKTRQPLREVAVAVGEAREREALARLADLIVDELNVKGLRFVESADELSGVRVKPNLPVLGPKHGKLLPQIKAALELVEPAAFVAELRSRGALALALPDGAEVELTEGDLLIETTAAEGYRVERQGERAVALADRDRRAAARGGAGARDRARGSTLAQERRFTHRRHDKPGAARARRRAAGGGALRVVHQGRDAGE